MFVPPFATARVPANVIVPDVVIGLPVTESPVVPPLNATLVTVPEPPLTVAHEPSPRKYVVTDGVPVALIPPTGRPVALVKVTEVGVPRMGVTSVGLVERTLFPEPVLVVTPVPPFVTASVPVTPVASGSPVAFVRVAEVGVPRTGVTRENDPLLIPFNAVTIGVKLLSKYDSWTTPVREPNVYGTVMGNGIYISPRTRYIITQLCI
jgi:hypothetical protein